MQSAIVLQQEEQQFLHFTVLPITELEALNGSALCNVSSALKL